jgi:hypothetical protein
MKHNMIVSNDADDYTDVEVTVTLTTGEQYMFMVSRDNSTNTVFDDDHVRYAKNEGADFSDGIFPPKEVNEYFKTIRQQAVDMMPPVEVKAVAPAVSVAPMNLNFYQVRVVSAALGLHCRVRMVAENEEDAKKMAKKEFKDVVQNFMSRNQTEPYVLPDHIAERFLCEVLTPQQPAVLALEWDKIGNKLSGER